LPRIYSVKDNLKDYILLLPDHSTYVKDVGLKTLEMLGLVPKAIEFIPKKNLLAIKQLTIVTQTCVPGYINDKIVNRISHTFLEGMNNKPAKPTRKLYISRE